MNVAVIGLGQVGFRLAVRLAEVGHSVMGIDVDPKKVALVNEGKSPITDANTQKRLFSVKDHVHATIDEAAIKNVSVVVVSVPTPVDNHGKANLEYILSTVGRIKRNMSSDLLISIESTVLPGTCKNVVLPVLQEGGLQCGRDFYLCHCPERIDPGNEKYPLEKVPRVLGAYDNASLEKAYAFYQSFLDASIRKVSNLQTAEFVKVYENAFRALNIGFPNAVARAIDLAQLDIDLVEVIAAAADKPYGFLAHYPGPGVGGDCINVVARQLVTHFQQLGVPLPSLLSAVEESERMPLHVVHRLAEGLNDLHLPIRGTKIGILGVAYKKNMNDTRNSPGEAVIKELRRRGAQLTVYDPHVPEQNTVHSLDDALKNLALVLCTDHDLFKEVREEQLQKAGVKVVVDTKACWNRKEIKDYGIIYLGMGR